MGLPIRSNIAAFAGISLEFGHTSTSASLSVGNWDTAQVLMAKLQPSLPGISWPMIEVLAQLRYAIQSRMRTLYFDKANSGKLWLIMDISFQPRHTSKATNTPPKLMFPRQQRNLYFSFRHSHHVFFDCESVDAVHSECHLSRHFTFRCRRLIPLGLCYYIKLCLIGILKAAARMPWMVSSVSSCLLEEGCPEQLNHKCTDLAK